MTSSKSDSGRPPSQSQAEQTEVSNDLKAIQRTHQSHRQQEKIWQSRYPEEAKFQRDFDKVAEAAQEGSSDRQKRQALRVLVRYFGRRSTLLLIAATAQKSHYQWLLDIRPRQPSEFPNGTKSHGQADQDYWDYLVCSEIIERMNAGQSKSDAIEEVKEAFRTGAPYPDETATPARHRPKKNLPNAAGIEKWMKRFRTESLARGHAHPYAASGLYDVHDEPDLKISDFPKRGRPRKK